MNIFDLSATLSIDTAQYESGLSKAQTESAVFGGALKANLVTAGLGMVAGVAQKAGGALVDFAADSIQTGMEFDGAMSQVAATQGLTMDEMAKNVSSVETAFGEFSGNLRDYAQYMGENTKFAATECADALNYMALAGYDVDTSMQMLPNVLNLAAAGNMDLARASDMVTDAQSAFGLSTEETSTMVDQMAKTASRSNTSVEELGDAYLTIGATARDMAGGTQDLSTVLGALADNGIKGTDGGIRLRNMILSLQNPTNAGAAALNELGVSVYDSEGNMRSMTDIIFDIQDGLEGMDQKSRNAMLKGIFNRTDMKAINAVVGTTKDRFGELSDEIGNASGAAQEMADTQLDNLAGDVTKFQSKMDILKIAISDRVTPALRDFVQFGTDGIGKITQGIKKDGLMGAFNAIGGIITEAAPKIYQAILDVLNGAIDKLLAWDWISSGQSIMDAFASGFSADGPATKILKAVGTIALKLLQAIGILAGKLFLLGVMLLGNLISGLLSKVQDVVRAGMLIVAQFILGILGKIGSLIATGAQFIAKIVAGIGGAVASLVKTGALIVAKFIAGVLGKIGGLIKTGAQLVAKIASGIGGGAVSLVKAGATLIAKFMSGLVKKAGSLIKTGAQLVVKITVGIASNYARLIKAGITLVAKVISGIGQVFSRLVKAGGNIIGKVISGIKSGISRVAEIGANIVTGIWNGISDKVGWIVDKVKGFASQVISAIKGIFGIKSPSKVMRDQVGRNLALGVAEGISKNAKYAKAAQKEQGDMILEAASKTLKDYKKKHDMGFKSLASYWANVAKITKDGSKAEKEALEKSDKALGKYYDQKATKLVKKVLGIQEKVYKVTDKYGGVLVETAEKWIKKQSEKGDLTHEAEIKMWKKVLAAAKKGSKAYAQAMKAYNSATKSKKAAQKAAKEQAQTLTDEYIKAYKEVQTKLAEEIAGLNSQLEEDIKKIDDELKSKIDEYESAYQEAVSSRASTIKGFFGLFDDVELDEGLSSSELIGNLGDQLDTYIAWDEVLRSLERRLGSSSQLYQALEDMDISSLNTLKSINEMSDQALQDYVKMYEQKEVIASTRAKYENEGLLQATQDNIAAAREAAAIEVEEAKATTAASIQALKDDAGQQVKELSDKYKSDIKELAKSVSAEGRGVGKSLIAGINKGIKENSAIIAAAAESAAKAALKSAKKTLGIKSPSTEFAWVGKMIDYGMAAGIDDNLGTVEDSMGKLYATAPDTVDVGGAGIGGSVVNDITMNIYGAQGQDVRELADIIDARLAQYTGIRQRGLAYA